jgi:hypothetical protein
MNRHRRNLLLQWGFYIAFLLAVMFVGYWLL